MSAFYTVLLFISFLLMSFSNEISKPVAQLQRLPNDDSDFVTMRTENFVYVDKTSYLIALLNTGVRLSFVTRPRRFGKTLFIDMMEHFFCGHQKLFVNLTAHYFGNSERYYNRMRLFRPNIVIEPWVEYPVIRLNFNSIGDFTTYEEFKRNYAALLSGEFDKFRFYPKKKESTFQRLVDYLYHIKFKNVPVIVLIDEYDHPFHYALETLKNTILAKDIENFTNQLLNSMKGCVSKIGIAFVAGVSRIPLQLLESGSGPNNFADFTHRPELAHAFGLTKSEINDYLGQHLKNLAHMQNKTREDMYDELVKWYDGYRFVFKADDATKQQVLNPVSTMTCLRTGELSSHWSSTGPVNYVLKTLYSDFNLYQKEMFDSNYRISADDLSRRYDPTRNVIPLPVWMFRYGYLTISGYHKLPGGTFVDLRYPNREIRNTIKDLLYVYVPFNDTTDLSKYGLENQQLRNAFRTATFVKVVEVLKKFSFIPFSHPSDQKISSFEITRRLHILFNNSGINMTEGLKFGKDRVTKQDGGDYDFLVTMRGINSSIYHVISVKCHGDDPKRRAYAAMKQLVDYTKDHPVQFWNTLQRFTGEPNPFSVHFLALGFSYKTGGELFDWVSVPYINCLPQLESIQTDSSKPNLKKEVLKLLQPVEL